MSTAEHKPMAEPHTCPKCATVTWSRNRYVVRCRICSHTFKIARG